MTRENSQKKAVLNVLQEKGYLCSIEAIKDMGITRLSAIIFNLKKEGHSIQTIRFTSSLMNRYGNHSKYCIYFYEGQV